MPSASRVLLLAAVATVAHAAPAAAVTVRDGDARFEVLSPSLIRAEYAPGARFEDRPTLTAVRRAPARVRVTTRVRAGWREIRTARMTLRWRRGSGPFTPTTLRLRFGAGADAIETGADPGVAQQALGGWTRALDLQTGPVPLHPGILAREGWHVVDDTTTAVLTDTPPGFASRAADAAERRDWYVFAYGADRVRALRDLRRMTGAAPLLDRASFGVWYSKYFPYSAGELRAIAADFRARGIPLGMVSLDTDYKRQADPIGAAVAAIAAGAPGLPFSWNGWDWNRDLFPDPAAFVAWAHGQGIRVAANIHPSINSNDPALPAVEAKTGPLATDDGMCRVLQADTTGQCKVFDWTKASHLEAYFDLHRPFTAVGVDALWLDWCCEAPDSVRAPGLNPDAWINSRYAADQRARGLRWPAFSRIGASFKPDGVYGDRQDPDHGVGALAEHRSTVQFTGDTCATWDMLAFEARMTTGAAAIGMPFVSHDIGSFAGQPVLGQCNGSIAGQQNVVAPELYARWVQFATFEPLDRLHSHHGRRLPWEYTGRTGDAAADALRLRTALVPTTYTLARRAHDTGLPVTGPLWLAWPGEAGAHEHAAERTFGPDIVAAPVVTPGDPARTTLWVPPGTWIDWFTGERFRGPATRTLEVPLSRTPVLVRAGAVVVTSPGARPGDAAPDLRVDAFRGAAGRFEVYEDAGTGLAYETGASRRTPIVQRRSRGTVRLTLGPARGTYAGAPSRRAWEVRVRDVARPRSVRVDGRVARGTYDAATRTLTVRVGSRGVHRAVRVVVR